VFQLGKVATFDLDSSFIPLTYYFRVVFIADQEIAPYTMVARANKDSALSTLFEQALLK
jgi:hypothetical protein